MLELVIVSTLNGVLFGMLLFLLASGLTLIFSMMGVLNFAHGVFLTFGAFLGWEVAARMGVTTWTGFIASLFVGAVAGAVFAALTERFLVQRLYERHIEQVLITVGLALAVVALFDGIWGTDPRFITGPAWMAETTRIAGANVPNDRFVAIVVAAAILEGFGRQLIDNTPGRFAVGGFMLVFWLVYFYAFRRNPQGAAGA